MNPEETFSYLSDPSNIITELGQIGDLIHRLMIIINYIIICCAFSNFE